MLHYLTYIENERTKNEQKKLQQQQQQILTLQLAESHEWACECDASDESSQEEEGLDDVGRRVRVKVRLLKEIVGEAGEDSSSSDKTVKQGHHLGEVRHLQTLGHHRANKTTWGRKRERIMIAGLTVFFFFL